MLPTKQYLENIPESFILMINRITGTQRQWQVPQQETVPVPQNRLQQTDNIIQFMQQSNANIIQRANAYLSPSSSISTLMQNLLISTTKNEYNNQILWQFDVSMIYEQCMEKKKTEKFSKTNGEKNRKFII